MEKQTINISKDLLLNDRYLLKTKNRLGIGSFGQIYKGIDTKTKNEIAIKIESKNSEAPQLNHEYKVLKKFELFEGFPKVYQIFSYEDILVLAMELLGDNLQNLLLKTENKKFSLKTTLMLSIQIIKLIQTLHENNYIHRDIKPENFTIGLKNRNNQLYMIDFGIAKNIFDKKNQHIEYMQGKNFMGNAKFCSIYTLMGIEQSRRDDLEAFGYMFYYFINGNLPWENIKSKNKIERNKKILDIKVDFLNQKQFDGVPDEFLCFMDYIKKLQFIQQPNYEYLISIFKGLMDKYNYKNDLCYEWCVKSKDIKCNINLNFLFGNNVNDNKSNNDNTLNNNEDNNKNDNC